MLLRISGIEVHPAVPVLVAFVVSFFTSMEGVSGAFLLLPFQMSVLGYAPVLKKARRAREQRARRCAR
jgi:uncharacterized protein